MLLTKTLLTPANPAKRSLAIGGVVDILNMANESGISLSDCTDN